jgi:hypothetical protein
MNEDEYDEVRRVRVEVAAHPVVEEDKPPVVRRVLLVAGIVAIVAILAWAWLSREETGLRSVPPALIGLWTSSHPEYSDRTLVLKSDSITFGIGNTKSVRYSIIGVVEEEEENLRYFVVHFRGEGGAKFRREIVLDDTGKSLFFRSQPHVVWTKFKL